MQKVREKKDHIPTSCRIKHLLLLLFLGTSSLTMAQEVLFPELEILAADTAELMKPPTIDTIQIAPPTAPPKKEDTFKPDPMKAVWYSALLPGAGQIYNRKYWKLPIVIGGGMGLVYAISWNSRYYADYSTAYRDVMDNDPSTNSYMNFYPKGTLESSIDATYLKGALKRKKDFFRRNRDLSIISIVGLYLICMVDAYVDAQLYDFDITPDVALKLQPTLIDGNQWHPYTLGLQCAICF